MVDEDLGLMYDQVIQYLTSKRDYFNDPTSIPSEASDSLDLDMTSSIDIIQRLVSKRPSLGEASLLKSYGDMVSVESEYNTRLLSRSDYWNDAITEETDNIDKWIFNKKLNILSIQGKDSGV